MSVINRLPIGGGASGLNVFTQLDEPSQKKGIWIKTNQECKKVTTCNSINSTLCSANDYKMYGITYINNNIYAFGDSYNGDPKLYLFINNTLDEQYRYDDFYFGRDDFYYGNAAININNRLYLVSPSGGGTDAIAVYSKTFNPDEKVTGKISELNNYIYDNAESWYPGCLGITSVRPKNAFGCANYLFIHYDIIVEYSYNSTVMRDTLGRYNCNDNTIVALDRSIAGGDMNSPCSGKLFNNTECVYYLSNTTVYEYNPYSNTYRALGNIPNSDSHIMIVARNIYAICTNGLYLFNKNNGTITLLTSSAFPMDYNRYATKNNDDQFVYTISNSKYIYKTNIIAGVSTLVLSPSISGKNTDLYQSDNLNFNVTFDGAVYFDGNGNSGYPTYYGDGSQWIQL